MTPPLLSRDLPPVNDSLALIKRHLSETLAAHRRHSLPEEELVDRLWTALDSALEILRCASNELPIDSAEASVVLETRDAIAIHLRAAADIEVADTLPEVRHGLVVRAAEILLAADIAKS